MGKKRAAIASGVLAALGLAGCGGPVNGWNAADVQSFKARYSPGFAQAESHMPARNHAAFRADAGRYLDCALKLIEPAASPRIVLRAGWSPPAALDDKLTFQCQEPFDTAAGKLVGRG